MKFKKLLCYVLSLMMIVSGQVFTFTAFADETVQEEAVKDEDTAKEEGFTLSKDYTNEGYINEQAKLDSMQLYFGSEDRYDYEIYGNEETGEVGFKDKKTGQILLTNPYDVAFTTSAKDVKAQLLSQIVLQYTDTAGTVVNFNSYNDAAAYGQIKMSKTRNGIRTDYTIGKEAAKYLVPKVIEKTSFEENILYRIEDKTTRDYNKLKYAYTLYDPFEENLSEERLSSMRMQYPVTEKYAIYVLEPGITNRELGELERYISGNTEYSFDKMEEDYALLDYVDVSAAPAMFRFAIEYSIDEYGIQIKLPAGSIKYDSSNYSLTSFKFLPYFCAGSNENKGFTFVPDGSGTITRFEDIKDNAFIFTGKMYGKDYSFHAISGYNQEIMRIPAIGVMETAPIKQVSEQMLVQETEQEADEATQESEDQTQETVTEQAQQETTETTETTDVAEEEIAPENRLYTLSDYAKADIADYVTKGYVAYFTEGDAMASISSDHGGAAHKYSSVYATFSPKPSDTYVLSGISSSGSATWSVTSENKYTGNYTMRVFPITGDGKDYTDMAVKIREYLEATGQLTRLDSKNDVSDDTALYLENFGTIKTQQKVAGFPVMRHTPLTTFEQTKDMVSDLGKNGIDNVNVRLTGWYNGGMQHTAPSKLSVPGVLGGQEGLEGLMSFAKDNNIGVYPDLDFTYVDTFSSFDGFSPKEDSAKTLDDRSAGHRKYNALYQGFEADNKVVISPASMMDFYGNIEGKLSSFGVKNLSVATLGSDLSSDYNDDYVLDREASKNVICNIFGQMKENKQDVMVDGGNAYSYKYADHILNVPLDSSMNINTSMSVPFMGMVLHGYTEFAGTPINLDGDYEYSVLKAIENGANLYYMVSKDNTSTLKAFPEFSKYYAIRYDNWKQDMIDTYTQFNDVMKGVKYSLITDHEYIGTRLVEVTYDNGTSFVLNYNTHDVDLQDGTHVEAMSFAVR